MRSSQDWTDHCTGEGGGCVDTVPADPDKSNSNPDRPNPSTPSMTWSVWTPHSFAFTPPPLLVLEIFQTSSSCIPVLLSRSFKSRERGSFNDTSSTLFFFLSPSHSLYLNRSQRSQTRGHSESSSLDILSCWIPQISNPPPRQLVSSRVRSLRAQESLWVERCEKGDCTLGASESQ